MPMILDSNQNHAKAKDTEVVNALTASMGEGGGQIPMVVEPIGVDSYNLALTGDVGRTITTSGGGLNEHIPMIIEPIGIDLYNQTTTGNKSKTLNAIKCDSDHVPCVLVLNDQGGHT